jgi:hypothetical protein
MTVKYFDRYAGIIYSFLDTSIKNIPVRLPGQYDFRAQLF